MATQSKFKVVVQAPKTRPSNPELANYTYEREALDAIGAALVEVPAKDDDAFIAAARDAHAILARNRDLSRRIIEKLEKCVIIAGGGVGTENVDVEAATEHGIVVTHVPDVFIEEVADHTLAMFLAAYRRLRTLDAMTRSGRWAEGRPTLDLIPRLWGQTMGLISFGNVARAVARRCHAFGLHVLAYDPYVSELDMTSANVEPVTTLMELAERSDFVSMHAPHNTETHHLMNGEYFGRMKKSALFINNGRGPTVDEAALIHALQTGGIAGAALDVFEEEPVDLANPLLKMDNVILTPHAASASARMRPESFRRQGREIALVLKGQWPRSAVNPSVLPKTKLTRWQPYPQGRGPNR